MGRSAGDQKDSRASPFPPAQRGSLLLGLGAAPTPSTGWKTRKCERMYLVRRGSTSASRSGLVTTSEEANCDVWSELVTAESGAGLKSK